MELNITMTKLAEFQFNGNGKYLVRAISKVDNITLIKYLVVRVNKLDNNKLTFDISNQHITHISNERLLDDSIFGGKDELH